MGEQGERFRDPLKAGRRECAVRLAVNRGMMHRF